MIPNWYVCQNFSDTGSLCHCSFPQYKWTWVSITNGILKQLYLRESLILNWNPHFLNVSPMNLYKKFKPRMDIGPLRCTGRTNGNISSICISGWCRAYFGATAILCATVCQSAVLCDTCTIFGGILSHSYTTSATPMSFSELALDLFS